MYRICEVNNHRFICDVQYQDGNERAEKISKEEAVLWVITTAKGMNHVDITEKDIKFSVHKNDITDLRLVIQEFRQVMKNILDKGQNSTAEAIHEELKQVVQDFEPEVSDDFDELVKLMKIEYTKAVDKFGPFQSNHEGYAIIKEEVDELWDGIKKNDNKLALKEEALQIAAMAIRFCVDL